MNDRDAVTRRSGRRLGVCGLLWAAAWARAATERKTIVGSELADILDAAAGGSYPPPDGGITVVPQPSHRDAGVIAFTAHSVVFTDEDPRWVRALRATLDCDSLAATMHPRFLGALLDRTGRSMDTIDLLTVASPLVGAPPLRLTELVDADHARVARARRCRDDVRVWATDGGVVVLGRGWPVGGRRRSRSTRSIATTAWGGHWRGLPGIWYPTGSRSGRSRLPVTREAYAPFTRRGFIRWEPKRCFAAPRQSTPPAAMPAGCESGSTGSWIGWWRQW